MAMILWTESRIARVKLPANKPAFDRLIATADLGLPTSSWDTGRFNFMTALASAYVLTGDPKYATATKELLLDCVRSPGFLAAWPLDSEFWDRLFFAFLGRAFDAVRDILTPAERTEIASYLMGRADHVLAEFGDPHSPWANKDANNNYYYGHLSCWIAALACLEIDPRAQDIVDICRVKFEVEVLPMMRTWGNGGAFAESTNYDSKFLLGLIMDAHKTVTGEDLFLLDNFFEEGILWSIHSLCPDGTRHYPLGDQPTSADGGLSDNDRMRVLVSVDNITDPTLKGYGYYLLDTMGQRRIGQDGYVDIELLYGDADAVRLDYTV